MIRVKGLWKRYGKNEVLKGLDLEVKTGETVAILGRSGVGKSVLLKQIMGIEKPDDGTIEVMGNMISELRGPKLYEALKRMGMLFQGGALFDSMTVGENTAFYLRQHESALTEREIQERVSKALFMVGLEGTQNLMPSALSGGMRKRAALARLIVYRPQVLLYDEPTTGLDPITGTQINDLILTTQKELNATSIVVTHDLRTAFHVANRIAFHHDGKILYLTSKKKFMEIDDPLVQTFIKNSIPDGELANHE